MPHMELRQPITYGTPAGASAGGSCIQSATDGQMMVFVVIQERVVCVNINADSIVGELIVKSGGV